jgi:hypothetical protein
MVLNEVYRRPDLLSLLQGVWQGRPQGGLVGVPTSKRPQINYAQYPRIPSKVLKGASHEEGIDDVVAEVAMSGVG